MVKIRLRRMGAKKQPTYRFVVADARSPRDGRFIEILGHYNPRVEPREIVVNEEKAKAWLAKGAQPSDTVRRLFAEKGADRFAHTSYAPGRTGSPIFENALAFVDCETIDEHDAGDHLIVVGRVLELGYQHEGKPLLFYRGGYGRFES